MKAIEKSKTLECIEAKDFSIITERIDDVALLIAQMSKMGLPDILDKYIPRRWNQRKLSWGWTATVWLSYILSEGDHRKVSMSRYISGMENSLSSLTGQEINTLDFDDDRLSHLLIHLNKDENWRKIEAELNRRSINVYELPKDTVRCDATTVSGYHKVEEEGMMQFGHSKDHPNLPQIKLMTSSLDPMGMPLATECVSGEQSDDVLYIPVIDRVKSVINKPSLLFVGDCKMSSLKIRQHIAESGHMYLCPLAMTVSVSKSMKDWSKVGKTKDKAGELEEVYRKNYKSKIYLCAKGYELNRSVDIDSEQESKTYTERVLVTHSASYEKKQIIGLDSRLLSAVKKLEKLTPSRGRGKRQIETELALTNKTSNILKYHNVKGLLDIKYEKEVETELKYIGRGRGSINRKQVEVEKIRYQITSITRIKDKISEKKSLFGWKVFVTNAPLSRLSFAECILSYRNEHRVERIFMRLKSRLEIFPLYVKRDDQIKGMSHLLMLGVRVISLTEFLIRRSLKKNKSSLVGLNYDRKNEETDKPTAERILKAFTGVTLTIIIDKTGNKMSSIVTSLSSLQKEILKRLDLDFQIYQKLKIKHIVNL